MPHAPLGVGVGINRARLHASELALAVVNSNTAADTIRSYETTMLPRSNERQNLLDNGAEDPITAELPDSATFV
ncbi:hypothetical protein ACFVXC_17980 [Streptomyces sp. NPDC058257]|uniref:hypothetical protein n=1 Tax=Streptomyces sp. NPDC058257 TaxID=3346409 RepID=UPI0036ED388D